METEFGEVAEVRISSRSDQLEIERAERLSMIEKLETDRQPLILLAFLRDRKSIEMKHLQMK
jgi:hypothetical protein